MKVWRLYEVSFRLSDILTVTTTMKEWRIFFCSLFGGGVGGPIWSYIFYKIMFQTGFSFTYCQHYLPQLLNDLMMRFCTTLHDISHLLRFPFDKDPGYQSKKPSLLSWLTEGVMPRGNLSNWLNWLRTNLMMCRWGKRPLRGRGKGGHSPGFRCLFESAQPGVIKEGTPLGFSADWALLWLEW